MKIEDLKKIASLRTNCIWRMSHIPVNCGHNLNPNLHYSDLWYAISPADTMDKSICNANFIVMAANNIDKLIEVAEAANTLRKVTYRECIYNDNKMYEQFEIADKQLQDAINKLYNES